MEQDLDDHKKGVLDMMERELMPEEIQDEQTKELFHYTDSVGFMGIVQTRVLHATHYAYTNDADEIQIGEAAIQEVAISMRDGEDDDLKKQAYKAFSEHHQERSLSKLTDIYVACLSEHPDLLSQWIAYGAKGSGFSIGFKNLPIPRTNNEKATHVLTLCKCEYDRVAFKTRVTKILTEVANHWLHYHNTYGKTEQDQNAMFFKAVSIMLRRVCAIGPALKSGHFSAEAEWRLVAIPLPPRDKEIVRYRGGQKGLVPYMTIDVVGAEAPWISSVHVGPTQGRHGFRAAKMFLQSQSGDGEPILKSSQVPFRG